MKDHKVFTRKILPVLVSGLMLGTFLSSEALAGAHKWEPAEAARGPGIVMLNGNNGAAAEEQSIVVPIGNNVAAAAGPAEGTVVVTKEAQEIDRFNGVSALCRPGGREDYDEVYSCVALVERYYREVYGIKVWNEYQFQTPVADGIGEFKVAETPEPGDIGYQTSDDGGPHWFILKRANEDGSFTVFEQNWKAVYDGVTITMVNRRVSYETTRDLRFFRRPGV